MSIPLFPSLRPNIVSPFWCDLDPPIDEEAEILELEREQRQWKSDISQMFSDVLPVGKTAHDVEDDDIDEIGDEEDDTTSSEGDDDMDDDDGDPSALFHVHDHSVPDMHAATEPSTSPPIPSNIRTSPGAADVSMNASGNESHSGHPVDSRRISTGSISPTSRAFIDAALRSPIGEVTLDSPENEGSDEDDLDGGAPLKQSIHSGQSSNVTQTFPGPVSDHLTQYQQMVASGHIRPSASSAQIDNLIESMHQAQRAHEARTISDNEAVAALGEMGSSIVTNPSHFENDSDNSESLSEEL